MTTWNGPAFSPLPPSGILPTLYDTRTGSLQQVTPLREGQATLYTCGITPYDSTHMGHAATYHAADLMRRALHDSGLAVRHAQNITDVDDPLFERARRDGVNWQDLAAEQTALFAGDMEALRILSPHTYLSVSEGMDVIIAKVRATYAAGRAYPVAHDDVPGMDWYLDLAQDGSFGEVSGWTESQMMDVFAERGGDPDRAGKKSPFDPLLWRAERPGEPAWDAGELGRGRPGWHIECVAIADEGLDVPVDIQAGGRDLIFPHHEMSHAHASALGTEFARIFAHVGMVAYEGTKMSKSLGNLVFVSKLVAEGADPMAIRLVLMSHHYRSDWEWTVDLLTEATARLARYREALSHRPDDPEVVEQLRKCLRDDLDTPQALRVLDTWAESSIQEQASSDEKRTTPLPGGDASEETHQEARDIAHALDALFGLAL